MLAIGGQARLVIGQAFSLGEIDPLNLLRTAIDIIQQLRRDCVIRKWRVGGL